VDLERRHRLVGHTTLLDLVTARARPGGIAGKFVIASAGVDSIHWSDTTVQ
jgi:hypothetical protein